MLKISEMDSRVTLFTQMEEKGGPVVLVNTFTVQPEDVVQLLEAWKYDASLLKRKPGFISTQLHRGIGGSCVFLNYAVWESVELFKQAFKDPEFIASLAKYPPSVVASPHLFKKVAVAGICGD
jgi:heme-degrading monooxygenase HmoA